MIVLSACVKANKLMLNPKSAISSRAFNEAVKKNLSTHAGAHLIMLVAR